MSSSDPNIVALRALAETVIVPRLAELERYARHNVGFPHATVQRTLNDSFPGAWLLGCQVRGGGEPDSGAITIMVRATSRASFELSADVSLDSGEILFEEHPLELRLPLTDEHAAAISLHLDPFFDACPRLLDELYRRLTTA